MPLDTDELFRVLADPTRRRILDLLSEKEPLSVNDIGKAFPDLVTSGISKHLMVLRAADLVMATRDGRHQYYCVNAKVLEESLAPWLSKYERYWTSALERLRDASERSG